MHTARFALLQGRKLLAPVPRGTHAAEAKSRGLLALTTNTGAKLCEVLRAQGQYRRVLERVYLDRPAAIPIRGRADYPTMLERLTEMLSDRDNVPAPSAEHYRS